MPPIINRITVHIYCTRMPFATSCMLLLPWILALLLVLEPQVLVLVPLTKVLGTCTCKVNSHKVINQTLSANVRCSSITVISARLGSFTKTHYINSLLLFSQIWYRAQAPDCNHDWRCQIHNPENLTWRRLPSWISKNVT